MSWSGGIKIKIKKKSANRPSFRLVTVHALISLLLLPLPHRHAHPSNATPLILFPVVICYRFHLPSSLWQTPFLLVDNTLPLSFSPQNPSSPRFPSNTPSSPLPAPPAQTLCLCPLSSVMSPAGSRMLSKSVTRSSSALSTSSPPSSRKS